MTVPLKREILSVGLTRDSDRAAELVGAIRCAGEIIGGDGTPIPIGASGTKSAVDMGLAAIVVRVPLDVVADRIVDSFAALFNVNATVTPAAHKPNKQGELAYDVRVTRDVEFILRHLGFLMRRGNLVVGLPPRIVSGSIAECESVWQGAILTRGVLADPARTTALEVDAPCYEAATALVSCARRLSITAKVKEVRGSIRVVIRDGSEIGALMSRLGAPLTRLEWDDERIERERSEAGNRLANFDDANMRRSVKAAAAAAARVTRALEIFEGVDVPDNLIEAATLRVRHQHMSLEELGRLADPPMTKDAIAGRIRRLLDLADARADELGIPNTKTAVAGS